MMASLRSALRAAAKNAPTPEDALIEVNQHMCRDTLVGEFATLFYGTFSRDGLAMTYCNAGHPPPVLIEGNTVQLLESGHTAPLGMTAHTPPSTELRVEKGSRIVLYTDGVIEARQGGELFGEDRLLSVCSKHADASLSELPKRIVSEVEKFSRGSLADDLAILVIAFQ